MKILKRFNEGAFSNASMFTIEDVITYMHKVWIRDDEDLEVENGDALLVWSTWYKLDGEDVELFVRMKIVYGSIVVEFIKKQMAEHVLATDTFNIEYDLTQVMETEVDPLLRSYFADLEYLNMQRRKIAILRRDIVSLNTEMEARVAGIENREYMKKLRGE